jgi:hypothetical protein
MTAKNFERILPGAERAPNTPDRPWVIRMSDWSADRDEDLLRLVEEAFVQAAHPDPLILVVDDQAETLDAGYRHRLERLAGAGAFLLEPQAEDEIRTSADLDRFIAAQASAAIQADSTAVTSSLPVEDYQRWLAATSENTPPPTGPHPSEPSQLKGYLEFAKAFTKLTPKQLKAMMQSRD